MWGNMLHHLFTGFLGIIMILHHLNIPFIAYGPPLLEVCFTPYFYAKIQRTSAGPVPQSAERWTPRGESTRPGYNSPGSKRDGRLTFMSLLTGMVAVGGRP